MTSPAATDCPIYDRAVLPPKHHDILGVQAESEDKLSLL